MHVYAYLCWYAYPQVQICMCSCSFWYVRVYDTYMYVNRQLQANLRMWAKARGGAVLPPLEDGQLETEVRVCACERG